uniref:GmrSD restriction endonucleases N-terminal domain-containing protein n=1 Tax=viral metagenome TaxID=1070528 RepID=A0A6C0EBQ6_9ZZZZ
MEDIKFTIRMLVNHFTKLRNINIDTNYQRGLVWINEDKMEFIKSIIDMIKNGIELPSIIVFNKVNNDYNCIDGKQRISAIIQFVDNIFGYKDNGKYIYYDKIPNINEDDGHNNYTICMSDKEREFFNNFVITTKIYKNQSYEREVNLFNLINNGTPLSVSETLMGRIKNKDIAKSIQEIASNYRTKLSKYKCSERGKHIRFMLKFIFFGMYSLKDINNCECIIKEYENKNIPQNRKDAVLKGIIQDKKTILDTFLVQNLFLSNFIKITHSYGENSLVIALEKLYRSKLNADDINNKLFIEKAIEYNTSIRNIPDKDKNCLTKIYKFADNFISSLKPLKPN